MANLLHMCVWAQALAFVMVLVLWLLRVALYWRCG